MKNTSPNPPEKQKPAQDKEEVATDQEIGGRNDELPDGSEQDAEELDTEDLNTESADDVGLNHTEEDDLSLNN